MGRLEWRGIEARKGDLMFIIFLFYFTSNQINCKTDKRISRTIIDGEPRRVLIERKSGNGLRVYW